MGGGASLLRALALNKRRGVLKELVQLLRPRIGRVTRPDGRRLLLRQELRSTKRWLSALAFRQRPRRTLPALVEQRRQQQADTRTGSLDTRNSASQQDLQ